MLRSLTVFSVGPRYSQWPVDVVQGVTVLFRSECVIMDRDVRIQSLSSLTFLKSLSLRNLSLSQCLSF